MIYLASASPRRHEILSGMGIAHTVLTVPAPPGEDEPRLPGEPPGDYVRRTARDKALRAIQFLSHDPQAPTPAPILAADTTVMLGDDILGKPADPADAARMLRRLSGTTHEVHSAIVLAPAPAILESSLDHGSALLEDVSVTQVRFAVLSDEQITAYCATGEPMGKAGGYGIQGAAATFIEHISGSYSGVMGLPIFETHRLLRQAALIP